MSESLFAGDERPYPEPEMDPPAIEEIDRWMWDAVAYATDGCEVEPDGFCEHGHQSWVLRLGFI